MSTLDDAPTVKIPALASAPFADANRSTAALDGVLARGISGDLPAAESSPRGASRHPRTAAYEAAAVRPRVQPPSPALRPQAPALTERGGSPTLERRFFNVPPVIAGDDLYDDDDDLEPPRSRAPLVIGTLAIAAIAGFVLVVGRGGPLS